MPATNESAQRPMFIKRVVIVTFVVHSTNKASAIVIAFSIG